MVARMTHEELMDEFFETNEFVDPENLPDWREMPELGEEPDEDPFIEKDSPSPEMAHTPGVDWKGRKRRLRIVKVDEEQRLVSGWASIIEEGGKPLVDRQGDVILEADLVEAAHGFMMKSRELGHDHKVKTGIGTVVDSIVFTADIKKALGLPDDFPVGWFVTAKVANDTVWAAIKSGELRAFSIGGMGTREPFEG